MIRPLTPADLEVADRINMAAFGIKESRLVDLRRYLTIQPDGWFLADQSGEDTGMVGAVSYSTSAYIGMLAVLPEHQGKKIGRCLMEYVVSWLDDQGIPTIMLDATEKGFPLYLQLGFSESDLAWVYGREVSSEKPSPQSGVISICPEELPELVEMDAQFFPGNRERVFRSLLASDPNSAFLTRNVAGQISGYIFIQGSRLGPWAAGQPEDAERLLKHVLSLEQSERLYAVVPEMNKDAAALFTNYGFKRVKSNRHMVRGAEPAYQRQKVFGQTSSAIG